ncbi:hypothetical protein BMS3Bbin02_02319 [bacterium BMS3Bbin02]|nr:hypothetical protein BMS3Bbin02_02319 [bacterium BMS3Bbin02]
MDQRVSLESSIDVTNDREVLPLNDESLGTRDGSLDRLGDHDRNVVGLPSRNVRWHRTASRPVHADDDRLVKHRETVLVHRDVGRGENSNDTWNGISTRCVHGYHAGMRLVGEHNLGVERVVQGNITRI